MRTFLAAALIAGSGPLAAQSLAYEGGLSMTTGRYFFDTRTTNVGLFSGLALSAGPLTLRAGVPVLAQNTELVTASGIGGMPSGGPISGMVSDSGRRAGRRAGGRMAVPASVAPGYATALGDPTAMLTVRVVDGARAGVTVGTAVKFPIADTTTFGTGQWDAGVSLAVTLHPGTRTLVGIDASYWRLGDLPALDFRDPLTGTLTVGRVFDGWGASFVGTAGTSALRGYQAPAAVGASVHRLSSRLLWGVTAMVGLTETVPDLALSASWRVQF